MITSTVSRSCLSSRLTSRIRRSLSGDRWFDFPAPSSFPVFTHCTLLSPQPLIYRCSALKVTTTIPAVEALPPHVRRRRVSPFDILKVLEVPFTSLADFTLYYAAVQEHENGMHWICPVPEYLGRSTMLLPCFCFGAVGYGGFGCCSILQC